MKAGPNLGMRGPTWLPTSQPQQNRRSSLQEPITSDFSFWIQHYRAPQMGSNKCNRYFDGQCHYKM